MVANIFIAVFGGLTTAVIAVLGVVVTLHPTRSRRKKGWYLAGFIACGLIACGLTGWQAYRNERSQSELRAELDRIEHNTKQPPPTPVVNVYTPNPTTSPVPSPGVSLRERANKLAGELDSFERKRNKGMPECVQSANSTPDQLKSCEDARVYGQETYKIYTERFAVRAVTIIQEFKAKGIDVSSVENCAAYGCGGPHPIYLELRAWSSRLDDHGDLRQ